MVVLLETDRDSEAIVRISLIHIHTYQRGWVDYLAQCKIITALDRVSIYQLLSTRGNNVFATENLEYHDGHLGAGQLSASCSSGMWISHHLVSRVINR